jgi:hypothetical protein
MKRLRLKTHPLRLKARKLTSTLVGFIAIVFIALLILLYLVKASKNLECFRIKDILINGNKTVDLSYLKGRNIFSVNLKQESRYLEEDYPNFRMVKMVRILPNRLFVDFVKRKPLAYVKLYRVFYVDEESVLFEMPPLESEIELPMIVGLESKIFGAKSGKKYNVRELGLALDIIKQVKRNRLLKDYELKRIDVTNTENISFFMTAVAKNLVNLMPLPTEFRIFEVRVSPDNLKEKINLLGNLLIRMKYKLGDLKYIDLRFKEVVIKYDNVK